MYLRYTNRRTLPRSAPTAPAEPSLLAEQAGAERGVAAPEGGVRAVQVRPAAAALQARPPQPPARLRGHHLPARVHTQTRRHSART